ncbi:Tat pathway signal protein [Halonotius terrestris]|uniref:Tat pathway signal protein n=1 Tax=Halonotius terrestris TaxID=2487750 RepID=A0A8J8P8N7_9EURY|nr:iron transporter [Halonotius terrestris]TQQ79858.1 Tat pathway signal protein [Halonotius terrestris]
MNRRTFLAVAGITASTAVAGCTGDFETTTSRAPAVLEDRPDAVYLPTHYEEMKPIGMETAGDITVGVMYSYPHRFWTLENEGGEYVTNRTEIQRDDAVHLMSIPFHEPTGTVIPGTGLSVEVTQDGSLVSQEAIYSMLSQRMGFHYGANFPLNGDGSYEVTVSVGGTRINRFGAFDGLFEDAATATIPFEYSEAARNEITYTVLEDEAGSRDALEPMEMDGLPTGRAPDPLPGRRIGEATSGDARFRVQHLSESRFLDSDATSGGDSNEASESGSDTGSTYVAISAQTPYNKLVIPGMGLDMSVGPAGDDAEPRFDGRLAPGIDPELGFHYGAVVDGLAAGDEITLTVSTVPQAARHEGYETAFLTMDEMRLQVPDDAV